MTFFSAPLSRPLFCPPKKMNNVFKASERSSNIEYAIRDVVVPADELEKNGHEIIKLNLGDPLAYPGLPTPNHMIEAYKKALNDQINGYSHSYGIPDLRYAISQNEKNKANGGWNCSDNDLSLIHISEPTRPY